MYRDYKVVKSAYIDEIEREVNNLISMGYIPLGGLVILVIGRDTEYYQTMIRPF